jgi:hypothetical protein
VHDEIALDNLRVVGDLLFRVAAIIELMAVLRYRCPASLRSDVTLALNNCVIEEKMRHATTPHDRDVKICVG